MILLDLERDVRQDLTVYEMIKEPTLEDMQLFDMLHGQKVGDIYLRFDSDFSRDFVPLTSYFTKPDNLVAVSDEFIKFVLEKGERVLMENVAVFNDAGGNRFHTIPVSRTKERSNARNM